MSVFKCDNVVFFSNISIPEVVFSLFLNAYRVSKYNLKSMSAPRSWSDSWLIG